MKSHITAPLLTLLNVPTLAAYIAAGYWGDETLYGIRGPARAGDARPSEDDRGAGAAPSPGGAAATFPVADPWLGERVCLAVVPIGETAPDPHDILEHLAPRACRHPTCRSSSFCLAEMPLTASGKIVKRELMRWVAEGRVQPLPVCFKH